MPKISVRNNKNEILIVTYTLLSAVGGVIMRFSEHPYYYAGVVLLLVGLILLVHGTLEFTATSCYCILYGHDETVRKIADLIKNAKQSVWMFRAHKGTGSREELFYAELKKRLIETDSTKRLQHVRRNSIIHQSSTLRNDMMRFVDDFASCEGVELALVQDSVPRVSVLVIDEAVAVLGFPNDDGYAISVSLFVDDPRVVRGIANAYRELWLRSTVIFASNPTTTKRQITQIKEQINEMLASE